MMKKLSDEALLEELKNRIAERKEAYRHLERLNQELDDANKRLIESEKLKSNFLSNARNEVINPLSSILSLSQTIAGGNSGNINEMKHLAGIIYKSAFDLNFQMNNIFASAEIEAGEAVCEFYQVDLPGMVQKSIQKFESLARENQQKLTIEKPAQPSKHDLHSDPGKVQLILDNLIVNAISWSKNKGIITIRTGVTAKEATIAVNDPGPVIDEKNREQIFNRFKTLDTSVHTLNKGHGLGLSIVKSYVELLDGSIAISSHAKGGNTFTVSIKNQPSAENTQGTSESGNDFLFDEQTELF